ncbi:MAG: heme-binding protein, partial [Pirellulales bacterium]
MSMRYFIILLILCLCCHDVWADTDAELPGGGQATPVDSITLPTGFRIQLLRSAHKGEGSWISMTFDEQARLILGRDKRGVVRLTMNEERDGVDQFEILENTLKHCRGVLYAHSSLYVCATDSRGFYRLRDTNGDDRFDDLQQLKSMDYQSRYGHGTNQVVLGPDNMLYVVNGNDVAFPEGTAADSPYRDPHDDHLLPEPRDAIADNRVGHILRTDPEGKHWEVIAGGFRNQVDVAFNTDGEMFTYDADMEWDIGSPWYRPTRVNHVTSGSEFGWRSGTGKWPSYYLDSLPAVVDIGPGSPTGITFGTGAKFPEKYQRSLFIAEWIYGVIYAVHMTPDGASFRGKAEQFVSAAALQVSDMVVNPGDGAFYFTVGGRETQ